MTTRPDRYTAEQMAFTASVLRMNRWEEAPAMLDQAIDDAARLQSLEAENARLLELVLSAEAIFQHCDVTDGMCGCGEDMKNHPSPMDCGHSPVDHATYVVNEWLEKAYEEKNS